VRGWRGQAFQEGEGVFGGHKQSTHSGLKSATVEITEKRGRPGDAKPVKSSKRQKDRGGTFQSLGQNKAKFKDCAVNVER